ncbi:MAG: Fic family protein [Henriciella sp.]|nr:Fic family protein [Henriciella sp.]MBO6696301.1 Fic family protein [Henriciella sp.]
MPNQRFSDPVTVFHDRALPELAKPVGYTALIDAYDLKVPLPLFLYAVGPRHRVYERDNWHIYTPRHDPRADLEGHLTFALKYEGLDLAVLKRLFQAVDQADIAGMVRAKPTSAYTRRIWFLYEWLIGEALDLPDAKSGSYADIIDDRLQYPGSSQTSTRHRVRNNLPGTPAFCPLVRRTPALERKIEANLHERASTVIANISASVLARTAAFLLLKDSKSSFAIEGEAAAHNRIQRWGRAIGQAGRNPLNNDEFLRLQRIVMGDARFIRLGFRNEGGFVGEHEQGSRLPLPDHISAKPDDVIHLIEGLITYDHDHAGALDPVIAAAIIAFGFVYIHPFVDGNGRVHRYLIHHVLTARGFNPAGMVFPISSAILERIDDYRKVLESYSKRLLPLIDWRPTDQMNVEVLNETADFYRYFDATPHAEFLYECVEKTIEEDLPQEAEFLERYDAFKTAIDALIEMPDSTVNLLFNFLRQHDGTLSKRARENEFSALSAAEIERVETIYTRTFAD